MTREEAINYFKRSFALDDIEDCIYHNEVLEFTIKALEQEPILDKIRAEIEQEYKDETEHHYGQGLRRAIKIIDKYKAESEGDV